MQRQSVRRAVVGALLTSAAMSPVLARAAVHALPESTVTVRATSVLGTIPKTAYGLNTAVWDPSLPSDPKLPRLLRALHVKVLRYPGGSTSDVYDWKTNTIVPGQNSYANPDNGFDNFMKLAKQVGAQPIITANYGTNFRGTTGGGDPKEAAAWVKYANITHHYGVKYWEIGNEIYGNGSYSGSWEADQDPVKGPQEYADKALKYIHAMKAVDPSIQVGAVLTAPNNWPWGQVPDWNQTVLQTVGSKIDFVIVHWYPQQPGSESDSGLLASTSQIPSMMSELKQEISDYAGANAKHIQIFLTETNSVSSNPGKQSTGLVNALFLADDYMNWLQSGVSTVDWWDLYNGVANGTSDASLYGKTNYGDYGLLSADAVSGSVSEPPRDTPFPDYYGFKMLSRLGLPGDTMVSAQSTESLVSVHAVHQKNGSLAVMLINQDPTRAFRVNLKLTGFKGQQAATEYFYGKGSHAIAVKHGVRVGQHIEVRPYSITTFVIAPVKQKDA